MQFTFKKNERLTGEKRINHLFANGQAFVAYPMRVVFLISERVIEATDESKLNEIPSVSILVSVPKKRLKSAVKRNRIKRLIRETYRLNKHLLITGEGNRFEVAFVYVRDELSDYVTVEKGMLKALKLLSAHAQQIEKQLE